MHTTSDNSRKESIEKFLKRGSLYAASGYFIELCTKASLWRTKEAIEILLLRDKITGDDFDRLVETQRVENIGRIFSGAQFSFRGTGTNDSIMILDYSFLEVDNLQFIEKYMILTFLKVDKVYHTFVFEEDYQYIMRWLKPLR
jgi:hypothetical protein